MTSFKYIKMIINIGGYHGSGETQTLKDTISNMYGGRDTLITVNGRSAIYLFLKSLNLEQGSVVAIQAFTCNAVVNPILSLGLTPRYIDIESDTFNMSLANLIQKDNGDIKVLILQHTFGIKANEDIIKYCKQKGIYVLEDCAHTLGSSDIGTLGDASMISFGLEKMLNTRVGGALIVNTKEVLDRINALYTSPKLMSKRDTFLWLLNPVLWRILRKFPNLKSVFKSLKLLKSGFTSDENMGNGRYDENLVLTDVLSSLVIEQIERLDDNLSHRREMANIYKETLDQKYDACIRYPYIAKDEKDANRIVQILEKMGYPSLERWFFDIIFPQATNIAKMRYEKGSCPNAEFISARIVNLPTGSNVTTETAHIIAQKIMHRRELY